MSFSIKSVGHAFSIALHDTFVGLKAVEGVSLKVADNKLLQDTIETVTAATFGTSAVDFERAVFAVAGELAAALKANDAATSAKLQDAGLDMAVINDFKGLISSIKSIPSPTTKK